MTAKNKQQSASELEPVLEPKPILIGMSGGVDSSVAAALLSDQVWKPTGVTLILPRWQKGPNKAAIKNAQAICQKLGIPHVTIDAKQQFEEKVVEYFEEEYAHGRTPNPCAICNRDLKFKLLFDFADQHQIEHIATGHYVRIEKSKLLKGSDPKKDQSYYLSLLPKKWLKRMVTPLGKYTKAQVYDLAKKFGFDFDKTTSASQESQDFCYLADSTLEDYLAERLSSAPGQIIDTNGKTIGQHDGLHRYTIGQRQGIKLSGGPYFVKKLQTDTNTVVVTKDESDLFSKEATLTNLNIVSLASLREPVKVQAKVRYQAKLSDAVLKPIDKDTALIQFNKPQRAITPGQVCAFYDGDICLGGGIIGHDEEETGAKKVHSKNQAKRNHGKQRSRSGFARQRGTVRELPYG